MTAGALHAGEAFNTIPDTAVMVGTVRCFDEHVRQKLEHAIRRTAEGQAATSGASAEISYEPLFAPTVNAPEQVAVLAGAAVEVAGSESIVWNPPPEMGSEDFSFMLQRRPGCYFLIGQGDADHQAVAHDTNYDFNDGILALGASIWVQLVERRLAPEAR